MKDYEFKGRWIAASTDIEDRFAPLFKKDSAIAKPIPLLPPVIKATSPFKIPTLSTGTIMGTCLTFDSLLNLFNKNFMIRFNITT